MKHEITTDRKETRITLPGQGAVVFLGDSESMMRRAAEYANKSKDAIIEVRHVVEFRVEGNWERKT